MPPPSVGVPPSAGVPPSVVVVPQSAGTVGLPMQISQRSQVLAHWVTCVQGEHLAGLLKSAAVQVGSRRIGVAAPGTTQQPKQSHPFGVRFRQKSTHCCDCDADTEHSDACSARSRRRRGTSRSRSRVALELPVAAVVAHARVAVEEAVLLAGVAVVAGDPGGERPLVVVEGADALGSPKSILPSPSLSLPSLHWLVPTTMPPPRPKFGPPAMPPPPVALPAAPVVPAVAPAAPVVPATPVVPAVPETDVRPFRSEPATPPPRPVTPPPATTGRAPGRDVRPFRWRRARKLAAAHRGERKARQTEKGNGSGCGDEEHRPVSFGRG